jgi:hypothetical protein
MAAAFRAERPKTPQELDAQLTAFQAAFLGIQRERDPKTAIAWCGPAIDVLQESAQTRGFSLPDWFTEIASIVQLHALSEQIKSATAGLAKALDDIEKAKAK